MFIVRFGKRCLKTVSSAFNNKKKNNAENFVITSEVETDSQRLEFFEDIQKKEEENTDKKFDEKVESYLKLCKYFVKHRIEFITYGPKQKIGWCMAKIKNIKGLSSFENANYTYEEKKLFILYVEELEMLFKHNNINIYAQPESVSFEGKDKQCCICQCDFDSKEEVYCCELAKKNMSNMTINCSFDHYYHKKCYIDMIYSDLEENPSHNKCCLLCPNKICDTQQIKVIAN